MYNLFHPNYYTKKVEKRRLLSTFTYVVQISPLNLQLYVALVHQQLSKAQTIIFLDRCRASTSFAK